MGLMIASSGTMFPTWQFSQYRPPISVRRSNHAGPYRSCGALGHSLPLEGRLAFRGELLIHLVDHGLQAARVHVAAQFGLDASWMYGRGAHATPTMPSVERHGEEDIGRLRSAISGKWIIGRPLEIRIREVDVGEAVTRGGQIDQPRPGSHQRRNSVDQNKVAQMIGAELCFEAVRRMPQRRGHHSRICDDDVEGFPRRQQRVGAGTHARKAGQIQRHKLEASTLGRSVLSNLSRRRFSLCPNPAPHPLRERRALRGSAQSRFRARPKRLSPESVCLAGLRPLKHLPLLMSHQT